MHPTYKKLRVSSLSPYAWRVLFPNNGLIENVMNSELFFPYE